jgi:signal transduction histidine kinase
MIRRLGYNSRVKRNPLFRQLRFRTKLALAIVLLFVLTVVALFAVDTHNEQRLIDQLEATMDAVTTAIQVASEQAQLSTTGTIDAKVLQEYVEKLRLRGVREIQILNPERAVIASSKSHTDSRAHPRKKSPTDISITGTISGGTPESGPLREYRLIMPIISRNEKVGYVTVDLLLDDYRALISQNFRRRLAAVSLVFGVGIVLVLVLTRNFTQPIGDLSTAAQRVAEGDLNAEIPSHRSDDVGALVSTWNAMLTRLKEQRALEARLAAAERGASLGHLASGIAHEIRNPLNTIALAVDYLGRRFAPTEETNRREFTKTTESLREEIARLNSLITNFLAYGKPLELNPTSWDAAALIRSIAEDLGPEAALRHVNIDVEGDGGEIVGDRGLLKSAFLNVALNALQMMPAGGRLKISLAGAPDRLKIRFDDSGPGIVPENLAKIFEPYFSTRDAGVGLGLAMTRKIVANHGGELLASNRREGGSRFEFVLPRSPQTVAAPV